MSSTRPAVPSTAQKRAAAAFFEPWDADAADSTTESESETERLERYPAKRRPSPRKTSSHMREQLRDARVKTSRKKASKAALKAEMEAQGRGLAIRPQRRRRSEVKQETVPLERMPEDLPRPNGAEDDDAKPGSGQVFLDDRKPKRDWDAVMRARRAVVKQVAIELDAASGVPQSDMGLFSSLPGELRNRIYRFALVEGEDEPFLIAYQEKTCNLGACIHMKASTAVPGILSACKQIRAEAMPIFAAENSFKFDDELVKARCVPNWLRVIGPYAELIDKVVLDIVCWEVAAVEANAVPHKIGKHYSMTLRWVTSTRRWSLHMDRSILVKARNECSVLDEYISTLNRQMVNEGTAKGAALREFVWSDWLAKLVYVCRK